jgi:hypothetical protein
MDSLEDIQLRTEAALREVDARPNLFGDSKEDLQKKLKGCEKYLRGLLRQYEGEYAERHAKSKETLILLSEPVREFIRRPNSDSADKYFELSDNARGILLRLIEESTAKESTLTHEHFVATAPNKHGVESPDITTKPFP